IVAIRLPLTSSSVRTVCRSSSMTGCSRATFSGYRKPLSRKSCQISSNDTSQPALMAGYDSSTVRANSSRDWLRSTKFVRDELTTDGSPPTNGLPPAPPPGRRGAEYKLDDSRYERGDRELVLDRRE